MPKRKRDIVRVEKNLNSFGFFTPLHKRVNGVKEKTVTVFVREGNGHRAEGRATILPSAKLGLPTTADQDKYYAFQKLLEQIRKTSGVVTNPITFTSAELLKLLGRKKSGQGYKEIAEWMERMTLTGIRSEGVVWLAGRKSYARDTFTLFSRAVTMGQELSDGRIADQNYVWLSDWQLENLNGNYVLPIDYDIYRSLKLNIAKALVPLLQVWFYAARRNPNVSIEKRYSELCQVLSIRQYPHLSKIREVLGPSLDELREWKVLQFWDIDRTSDGADFKLVLIPGERFLTDVRARLAGREDAAAMHDPRLESLLRAMAERGIHEDRARRLLLDLPDDQPVMDQLEYGDHEVRRRQAGREPIVNPPGFYLYLVETNFPVPAGFETTRKRELRAAAAQKEQLQRAAEAEQFLRREALREEYQAYRDSEIDRYIAGNLKQQDLKNRLKAARTAIHREHPGLRLPEPAAGEIVMRRVRENLAETVDLMTFEEFCRQRQLSLPL